MSSEMVPTKTFQERVRDRIRETIGDLITDDDLMEIVQKGIDEVFFQTRTVQESAYNRKEIPPLIHEIVKEVLQDRMTLAVDGWLKTHEAEVVEAVKAVVQEGAGQAFIAALGSLLSNSMFQLQSDIQSKLR